MTSYTSRDYAHSLAIVYGNYILNRHQYDGKRRTSKLKPEESHINFDISPLISKERWDLIQGKIKFNKSKGKRISQTTKQYWLRDILECSECGGKISHMNGPKKADGSLFRYYRCYWHKATQKELFLSQRKKCPLPYLNANALEEEIWWTIVGRLSLGGFRLAGEQIKAPLETLVDPDRYGLEIKTLKRQVKRHEREIARIEAVYERVADDLLQDKDFEEHKALLLRKLKQNRDERFRLNSLLAGAREKIEVLREAKENDQLLREFLTDRKETLYQLQNDLYGLSPDDKKSLVESMVDAKIRIGITVEPTEDGKEHWAVMPYRFRFNRSILEQFISEGKLGSLNQNARGHSYR